MKKSELIERLTQIAENPIHAFAMMDIKDLIEIIKKEPIRNNQYKSKYKHIDVRSQKGQILKYLKNDFNEKVTGTDFMKDTFLTRKPYIGFSAGARLSELLRCGLVEKVGVRKGVMNFLFKSKDRTLYKITKKGIKYKLK